MQKPFILLWNVENWLIKYTYYSFTHLKFRMNFFNFVFMFQSHSVGLYSFQSLVDQKICTVPTVCRVRSKINSEFRLTIQSFPDALLWCLSITNCFYRWILAVSYKRTLVKKRHIILFHVNKSGSWYLVKVKFLKEFDKEQIIFWWRFCGTFKGVPAF